MNFDNLPTISSGYFAKGTAKGGCTVYIPCLSEIDIDEQKLRLSEFLATQPEPPKEYAGCSL